MMFMGVSIILGDEIAGPYATPHLSLVFALNLPWLLTPIFLTLRLWREHPFMNNVLQSTARSVDAAQIING